MVCLARVHHEFIVQQHGCTPRHHNRASKNPRVADDVRLNRVLHILFEILHVDVQRDPTALDDPINASTQESMGDTDTRHDDDESRFF